jgi:hypothetical protein
MPHYNSRRSSVELHQIALPRAGPPLVAAADSGGDVIQSLLRIGRCVLEEL